jgi:hypothetical protein
MKVMENRGMTQAEASTAKENATPQIKDFVVLVPLLATALAVMYDVGYFTQFDLSYFSFFSLSEHVVFALSALPFALIVSIGMIPSFFSCSISIQGFPSPSLCYCPSWP